MRKGFFSAASGLAGALLLASACSNSGQHHQSLSVATGGDSLEPLRQLAARQIDKPGNRSRNAPVPPGLPLHLGEPLDPEQAQQASLSLTEALALDEHASLPPLPPTSNTEIDEEDANEAIRSYVLGRAARLAGNLKTAEEELRRAAELDPSAPEIWRELAETQLALGNRPLATSAFRRTLAGSPDDVRTLEYLSTEALERRAMHDAIAMLARLRELDLANYDPALPTIVASRLGEALLGAGYLQAGSEALIQALELPTRFGQSTNYAEELGRVYRRRASLWVDVGDAALRRNDMQSAFYAYDRAAELPGGASSRLLARRVLAEMRSGRPASAALSVLETIDRSNAHVESESMGLLHYIARNSNVGPVVGRVVAGLAEEGAAAREPAIRRALVLAGAAVADDSQAVEILREWLAQAPVDASALRQLFDRAGQRDLASAATEAVALIAQTPIELERYALTLTGHDRTPEQVLEALNATAIPSNHSVPATILRARMLSMLARHDEAIELLKPLAQSDQSLANAAAAGLLVRLLSQRARWDEADTLAFKLAESADSFVGHMAAALALGIVDAEPEALESLGLARRSLKEQSQTMTAHLLGLEGQLLMSLGDYENANSTLKALIQIDPWRDEAYLLLGELHRLETRAESGEQNSTFSSPDGDSPTAQFLRAQASASTGRRDRALTELKALESAHPGRGHIVDLLAKVWAPSGDLSGAIEWFQGRVHERPGEAIYAHELTRLLMVRRRTDAALEMLASAWERTPGERTISKNFEALLRQVGGSENRVRASSVFRRRISRERRTPNLILDLAQDELRKDDIETTADLVVELAALDRPLHPEAAQWIEQQVSRIMRQSGEGRGRPFYDSLLRMHQAFLGATPKPRFEQYALGLSLLLRTDSTIDKVIEMCQAGATLYPDRASVLFRNAAAQHLSTQRGDTSDRLHKAARIAELGIATSEIDRANLAYLWVFAGRGLAALPDGEYETLTNALTRIFELDIYDEFLPLWQNQRKRESQQETTLAETAASLAGLLTNSDQHDLLERLYRDALQRDPTNLNAHNNLGYQLLSWGKKLEDAQALIETAYALSKTQFTQDERRAFVTDSLGWARYKLGIMHDEFDDKGNIVREGAIKILRRALSRAVDDANKRVLQRQVIPVVGDHLGDALWAAGEREWAIVEWTNAASAAEKIDQDQNLHQQLTLRGGDLDRILEEMRGSASAARAKLLAAQSDRQPDISPVFRSINQRPQLDDDADPIK